MTRINIGIKPEKLTDQHLLAEHREIKRLPTQFLKSKNPKISINFVLGTGHVLFFYDKGLYTYNRYCQLYAECIKRGFEIEKYHLKWADFYNERPLLYNDHTPTLNSMDLIKSRIAERISLSKQVPRYYKKDISKDFAIELIKS